MKEKENELEVIIDCNSKALRKELKKITKDLEKLNVLMAKLGKNIRALSDTKLDITVSQYRKDMSVWEFIKSKLNNK
jgi:arsenate reductase-like glutaredoxin family protein